MQSAFGWMKMTKTGGAQSPLKGKKKIVCARVWSCVHTHPSERNHLIFDQIQKNDRTKFPKISILVIIIHPNTDYAGKNIPLLIYNTKAMKMKGKGYPQLESVDDQRTRIQCDQSRSRARHCAIGWSIFLPPLDAYGGSWTKCANLL